MKLSCYSGNQKSVFHMHWVQLSTLCYLCSEKSGHGILEFSTDKAGQDVTPLNLEFGDEDKPQHKSSSGALNSIAGIFCTTQLIIWHVLTLLMEVKLYCIDVSLWFASLNTFTLTLILRCSHTGTVCFYTSTSNRRAARPKLYTKSLTRDLKLMYSRLTLVRISINL